MTNLQVIQQLLEKHSIIRNIAPINKMIDTNYNIEIHYNDPQFIIDNSQIALSIINQEETLFYNNLQQIEIIQVESLITAFQDYIVKADLQYGRHQLNLIVGRNIYKSILPELLFINRLLHNVGNERSQFNIYNGNSILLFANDSSILTVDISDLYDNQSCIYEKFSVNIHNPQKIMNFTILK